MTLKWTAEESNLNQYRIAKLPTEIATGTSTGYNMYQTLLLETTSLGRYYLSEFMQLILERYTFSTNFSTEKVLCFKCKIMYARITSDAMLKRQNISSDSTNEL